MSKLERFKAALLKAFAEFANVTTDKGILAWDGDADLAVGDAVFIEDAEGNRTPAEDGEYTTDEGKVIVVAEGKVAEIKETETEVEPTEETPAETPAEETPAEMASVVTDKGELVYEGELAVGTEVFVLDAEGNQVAAEEGEYVLENGTIIKVAEGKVAEIVEPAAEETAEETPAESEEVAALKAEIEKLQAEIRSLKKENKELSAKPMASAAHEEFNSVNRVVKTGDKGLDRLANVLSR